MHYSRRMHVDCCSHFDECGLMLVVGVAIAKIASFEKCTVCRQNFRQKAFQLLEVGWGLSLAKPCLHQTPSQRSSSGTPLALLLVFLLFPQGFPQGSIPKVFFPVNSRFRYQNFSLVSSKSTNIFFLNPKCFKFSPMCVLRKKKKNPLNVLSPTITLTKQVKAMLVVAFFIWYIASAISNTFAKKVLLEIPQPLLFTTLQFAIACASINGLFVTGNAQFKPLPKSARVSLYKVCFVYTLGFLMVGLSFFFFFIIYFFKQRAATHLIPF